MDTKIYQNKKERRKTLLSNNDSVFFFLVFHLMFEAVEPQLNSDRALQGPSGGGASNRIVSILSTQI